MILRKPVKALFFLLLLTLALVPVLQAAHALTHIAPGETGGIAQSSDGRFVGIVASEAEAKCDCRRGLGQRQNLPGLSRFGGVWHTSSSAGILFF